MLLGEYLLNQVARVWRYRERVELEAADIFSRLALRLKHHRFSGNVVALAERAAEDERMHALLCRRLVDRFAPGMPTLRPALGAELGPATLTHRRRAVYAAVAVGCVTETLSTALLLEMQASAQDKLVRDTVHHILKDEVRHSRLGWAVLAAEAARTTTAWLAPYIESMIRAAKQADMDPMKVDESRDLSPYGVLPPWKVDSIFYQTVNDVIVPGLRRFGVAVEDAGSARGNAEFAPPL